MKLHVKEKKKNNSLNRTELKFQATESKTVPSRKELREKIAALENAPTENVIVHEITPSFGKHEVNGSAMVYHDAKSLKEIELKYWIAANEGKKEKAAEKAEEKKEEKK